MILATPTDLATPFRHRETSGYFEVSSLSRSASTWVAATPSFTMHLTLPDITSEKYMLRRPVHLSVEVGPEIGTVLHEPITDTMGCGATVEQAVQELTELLIDSYEQLSENEDRLAPRLVNRLLVLRGVLKVRHGAMAHGAA